MDPMNNLNHQDLVHGNDMTQNPYAQMTSNRPHDLQHVQLNSTNILMDERGENILSSLLTNPAMNEIPVTNDPNFLMSGDGSFSDSHLLMDPQINKYTYDTIKDTNMSVPVKVVNSSPVKKALDKAKQSPFKKRGNFEEDPSSLLSYHKSDSKDYCHSDLPRHLMAKMFGLLKEGLFCDSVILSGNTEIRVHRLVLLAACPFILSKMSDLSQNASLKIELPQGIPLEVTSQLVHYLYDGKVTLTSDNVAHFARIANLFKLSHLIDICKDFVIMFGINQSILTDKGEDIVANVILDNKTKETQKKDAKTPNKKIAKKVPQKKTSPHLKPVEEPKEAGVISTPSHSYGTRRASLRTSATDKESDKDEPVDPLLTLKNTAESFPAYQPKHPIHTNAAFINSNKIKSKARIDFTNNASPEKRTKISQYNENQLEVSNNIATDSGILETGNEKMDARPGTDSIENNEDASSVKDEQLEIAEDFSDDADDDWRPHTKMKNKAFIKKGRAKVLKKSVTSFLKSTKAKKAAVIPEQKETYTLRPPPKKRAKEFARTEFEELEDILSRPSEKGIVHTFSMETKSSPEDSQQKSKKTQRLTKAMSYRASQLSVVVAKIEQKAEHLPENERHFICDICGNHYIFSKRAVTHIISVHDTELEDVISAISIRKKEKVLKMCDICGYETKEPNFFYIHFHRYFRHNVPLPKGMQPFKCDICGKECFTRFQLKDHKLIHEDGIPFICENCGQGFNSRTCLTSHVFHKHSKVRNHKCTDFGCEKSFKTKTQLMVHMRSHTGEKPFQCPDCQYKSSTRGNMRLHLTNKHKHKSDVVKNIMINLKASQDDDPMVDVEDDEKDSQLNTQSVLLDNKTRPSVSVNTTIGSSHESLTSQANAIDTGYSTVSNIMRSNQEQQLLYDDDPNTKTISMQQYAGSQSLLLHSLTQSQLELLPSDQNLHTISNSQMLVPSDNLQHHIVLQNPHSSKQTEATMQDDSGMSVQEARTLLQRSLNPSQQSELNLNSARQSKGLDLQQQSQRVSLVQDIGGKSLPQLVEVHEIQPIILHDYPGNILQGYDPQQYHTEEDQSLLKNTDSLLHKKSNQGHIYLSNQQSGNQSQENRSKIQVALQDGGQVEPIVRGLVLAPNTSQSSSVNTQDSRYQMEVIQSSSGKTATRMYLLDVNSLAGVDNDVSSAEQDQESATSIDNAASLSQAYNDPQLLYQLYQQYNSNYQ